MRCWNKFMVNQWLLFPARLKIDISDGGWFGMPVATTQLSMERVNLRIGGSLTISYEVARLA